MLSVPVQESSLIVVAGPRFTSREATLYGLLASHPGRKAVISTCKTAGKARQQYCDRGETDRSLTVIDCVSVPASCPEQVDDHHLLADHPANLTDIGTQTVELFERTNHSNGVFAVSNVTVLTVFHAPKTVLKFTHKLQQLTTGHGWTLIIEVDTTVEPNHVIAQLSERADALIQTRVHDGTAEYRVRGGQTQADWHVQPAELQPTVTTAATTPHRG